MDAPLKEKILLTLKSRKFWALLLAILAAVAGYATAQIDFWQFLQAVIASTAFYATGVAITDAGHAIGPKE